MFLTEKDLKRQLGLIDIEDNADREQLQSNGALQAGVFDLVDDPQPLRRGSQDPVVGRSLAEHVEDPRRWKIAEATRSDSTAK